MDAFVQAYIEAALWSSTDNSTPQGGEPLDKNYSISDIAPESVRKMEEDCRLFQEQNTALLESFYAAGHDVAQAGHDFWLNRNGHGTGFWDEEGPQEVTRGLSDASRAFKEQDIYVGDDGKLYVSGGESDQRNLPLQASLLKKADPEDKQMMNQIRTFLSKGPKTTGEIEQFLGLSRHQMKAYALLREMQQENIVMQSKMRWHLVASILHGLAITGRRTPKQGRELSVPERHQLRVAIDSMNMHPAMLGVMGGPNVEEARKIIKQLTGREFEQLPESMQHPSWRRTGSIPALLKKDATSRMMKERIRDAEKSVRAIEKSMKKEEDEPIDVGEVSETPLDMKDIFEPKKRKKAEVGEPRPVSELQDELAHSFDVVAVSEKTGKVILIDHWGYGRDKDTCDLIRTREQRENGYGKTFHVVPHKSVTVGDALPANNGGESLMASSKTAYHYGTHEEVYIYQAATLCQECGVKVKAQLRDEGRAPENPDDEHTFDSDQYPKGPYPDGGGESDAPESCDLCHKFLENPLTQDGYNYLREMVSEAEAAGRGSEPHIQEWKAFYPEAFEGDLTVDYEHPGRTDRAPYDTGISQRGDKMSSQKIAYTPVKNLEPQKDKGAWKQRLRSVYDNDFEQFEVYNNAYNIAKRLGFTDAKDAWETNPMISGSVYPEDLRVVGSAEVVASAIKIADAHSWMDMPTETGSETEIEKALRGLVEWAIGNRGSKTGNPYFFPEEKPRSGRSGQRRGRHSSRARQKSPPRPTKHTTHRASASALPFPRASRTNRLPRQRRRISALTASVCVRRVEINLV